MGRFAVGAENGLPIELHFTDQGQGQPVVLIHGWPLSGRSWEAQVPALVGAGYRVITYDRRGFGQSSQPWEGYDYDTFAADLAALVDHLDLRNMVLIGFSMGGGEVLRYLRHFGHDRVSKIVLASAVPPYLFKSEDNPDGGLDDATIDEFLGAVAGDRLAFLDGFLTGILQFREEADGQPAAKGLRVRPGRRGVAQRHGRLHYGLGADGLPGGCGRGRRAHPGHPRRLRRDRAVRGQWGANREVDQRRHLVVIKNGPHGVTVSHAAEWNAAVLDFLRDAR